VSYKEVRPRRSGIVHQSRTMPSSPTVALDLALKIPDRQAILETTAVPSVEKVLGLIDSEISGAAGREAHPTRVKRQIDKTSASFFSNEQMKAIPERDRRRGRQDELTEIEDKIKKTKLSKEAREKGDARAQKAPADVADVGGIHCGAQLPRLAPVDPWAKRLQDQEGPQAGPGVLDNDHFGLEEGQGADRRIPRRPAARQQADRADPVPGPAGRRRQDLARAKSIARATGRDFVLSLARARAR